MSSHERSPQPEPGTQLVLNKWRFPSSAQTHCQDHAVCIEANSGLHGISGGDREQGKGGAKTRAIWGLMGDIQSDVDKDHRA